MNHIYKSSCDQSNFFIQFYKMQTRIFAVFIFIERTKDWWKWAIFIMHIFMLHWWFIPCKIVLQKIALNLTKTSEQFNLKTMLHWIQSSFIRMQLFELLQLLYTLKIQIICFLLLNQYCIVERLLDIMTWTFCPRNF